MRRLACVVLVVFISSCASGLTPLLPDYAPTPPATGEALQCLVESPCPAATEGVWLPPEVTVYMIETQTCCNRCLEECRKQPSSGIDALTIALTASVGIAAGLLVGVAASRD